MECGCFGYLRITDFTQISRMAATLLFCILRENISSLLLYMSQSPNRILAVYYCTCLNLQTAKYPIPPSLLPWGKGVSAFNANIWQTASVCRPLFLYLWNIGSLLNNEPTNQPVNRLNDQTTNQPTNQPTKRRTDRPTNEPTNRPTDQPTTNQSTNKSTDQSTNQATDRPTNQPTDQPVNQPTDRPTDQSTNQPTN